MIEIQIFFCLRDYKHNITGDNSFVIAFFLLFVLLGIKRLFKFPVGKPDEARQDHTSD